MSSKIHDYWPKKIIFSSFIQSQFTYCPLIWMFCTKSSLCRINNIHEQCLRLIQQNYRSESERLLENANERSVNKNALNFFWLRFINTWMFYLLLLWTPSLNSDKIPITSEISTHFNLKILEQRRLASIVLHTELVSFGKMFPKKYQYSKADWLCMQKYYSWCTLNEEIQYKKNDVPCW